MLILISLWTLQTLNMICTESVLVLGRNTCILTKVLKFYKLRVLGRRPSIASGFGNSDTMYGK